MEPVWNGQLYLDIEANWVDVTASELTDANYHHWVKEHAQGEFCKSYGWDHELCYWGREYWVFSDPSTAFHFKLAFG